MSGGINLPATFFRGQAFLHARRSFPIHAAKAATDRAFPAQVARRMCRYPTKRRETLERFGPFHHGQDCRSSTL